MKSQNQNILLSENVTPSEYFITIQPDLSRFTFKGSEKINLDIKKPTDTITIHSDELKIMKASYNNVSSEIISYDAATETAKIKFSKELQVGSGELFLQFSGILNDKMRGFYRSRYKIDGKEHIMAVTQFESTDARRAFPCFDEPAKKAIFHIKLIVPEDQTAISNTIETEIKTHSLGYKIVSFEPTPKMSTYLLAFVVGKFEHIEKRTKEGTLVRIFVTPGKKKQAEFALNVASKTISFFSDYFKIKYPLPVIDLIAIPDFAAGAMENWGCVTYRETALLIDAENSAVINKQWVALVIAHEFAHQWFGNLVTMEWWTHLWLNEGFASYIEYLAVDHIFPEWEIWTQFVNMDHSRALDLDGLENTHPIEVEVNNPTEISEIFDAVSYSKGASIIRMLASYLGDEVFRKGLNAYLTKYSYGNASTIDLWNTLGEVSGKRVDKIMNNWTQKAGYPLISVEDQNGNFLLSQCRFFSSASSKKNSKDNTVWQVPIGIITDQTKSPVYKLINTNVLKLTNFTNSRWIKINSDETSLVRVRYSDRNLDNLLDAIAQNQLGIVDRYGIIRDVLVLAEAAELSTATALHAYSFYENEDSYVVWSEIANQLARIDNLLVGTDYFDAFQIFALSKFKKISAKISWEQVSGESHSTTLLRTIILSSLSKYKDKKTIIHSKSLFNNLINSGTQINSDLRGIVYTTVARNGNKKTYDQLLKLYKTSPLQEEKDRIFKALCAFSQKSLLMKSLDFGFSKEVRTQDSYKAIHFVLANPYGRDLAWDYLKTRWEEIVKRYSGGHLFSRFVEPLEFFTHKKDAEQIKLFFDKNKAPGAERTIKQVIEKINSNDAWLSRDYHKISKSLSAKTKR